MQRIKLIKRVGKISQANEETYTVINGKRVSLKQAQAAQEAQEAAATKTGIQEAHNNHTEAVKAGAKGTQTQSQQTQQQTVKQGNVQSGQQELEQHMQQAGQQIQQQQQQAGQTPTEALEHVGQSNEEVKIAKARAKTKNQASE